MADESRRPGAAGDYVRSQIAVHEAARRLVRADDAASGKTDFDRAVAFRELVAAVEKYLELRAVVVYPLPLHLQQQLNQAREGET